MKALIITDIQYDFLPGRSLAVPGGDEIIPLVNRLQEVFPLVVATQDWHPSGHSSFASSHPGKSAFEAITYHGSEQILWPDHCVQNSRGAEISTDINQHHIEAIFRKGMNPEIDSYSAFYDNEHKKSTGLADYLKGRRVTQVYLVGLAADFCVGYSALDALNEGFETYLVEDATRAISKDGFLEMKNKVRALGGQIIHSGQLL
jgi:nicotinamidase/pyrazinamidase